jgi:hypothetical protein
MNTKLLLQVLLALGCLAMAIGIAGTLTGRGLLTAPEGWWRGAMACWMLIVAIRMVYPAHAK